ncbi:MAG: hypothetical protein AABZ67_00520 [Pseudomonadota bacterium]
MDLGALAAFSSAVPRGYSGGVDARQIQQARMLEMARAREAMADAEVRRGGEAALGGYFGSPMVPGAQPYPPMGPQPPAPGQPSLPMQQSGAPTPIIPWARPPQQQQGMPGLPPGSGAGAPAGGALPRQNPAGAPNPTAGVPNFMDDLHQIAQRIRAQNPAMDDRSLYFALEKVMPAMGRQAQMEMLALRAGMMQDMKQQQLENQRQIAEARNQVQRDAMTSREGVMRDMGTLRAETARDVAGIREKSAEENRALREKHGAESLELRRTAEQRQRDALKMRGEKDRTKREAEVAPMGRLSEEADELAALVGQDPSLVGLKGGARRVIGSVGSQTGLWEGDKSIADFRNRIIALQTNLKNQVYKSKYFSKNARTEFERLMPALDALDSQEDVSAALGNMSKQLKAMMAEGGAERTTATNPETGEQVEWDGKAWLPVKQ